MTDRGSSGAFRPQGRRDGLLVTQVGDEIVVYDGNAHQAHTLNRTAALLWEQADGHTSVDEMSALLGDELGVPGGVSLVWVALESLRKAGLVASEGWPERNPGGGMSRRQALRALGVGAGVALAVPVVESVTVPVAAQTVSCTNCCRCRGEPDTDVCASGAGAPVSAAECQTYCQNQGGRAGSFMGNARCAQLPSGRFECQRC